MSGWFIYALGGGWGHLTRAVALAQIASKRHPVRILTNSPYAARVRRAVPVLDVIALEDPLSRDEAVALICAAEPECLIVDTFPRGLGGELANILSAMECRRILAHRDLDPEYVREAGLTEFVASNFDLVIIPGEDEGGSFPGIVTNPWLVQPTCSFENPLGVLVCASGTPDELAWFGAVMNYLVDMGVGSHCIAPVCPPGCPQEFWIQHWPASDLYPCAEAVVGGAGYNTVYGCLARGIPLVARPWPRLYDRQDRRARLAALRGSVTIVEHPREAAQAAARARATKHAGSIHSGVGEAVARIERSLS